VVVGCNATPLPLATLAVEFVHDRLQKFLQLKSGWCFMTMDPPAGPVCTPSHLLLIST
jgi:hypothetical protein